MLASRDGHEVPVSMVMLAHKGAEGTVEFFSIIARDISDQNTLLDVVAEVGLNRVKAEDLLTSDGGHSPRVHQAVAPARNSHVLRLVWCPMYIPSRPHRRLAPVGTWHGHLPRAEREYRCDVDDHGRGYGGHREGLFRSGWWRGQAPSGSEAPLRSPPMIVITEALVACGRVR